MSFNRIILMGRITHDLEIRTTPTGINVLRFQIAVDRRFQTKGEERKTDFFRITAWRQQADFINRYFRKGSMILVEGELQNDVYTDKSGNTVNSYQIVVDQVSFTGEKANNSQNNAGSYGNAGGYQQNGYNNGGYAQGGGYNAPPAPPAPSAPNTNGAPADFSAATDDNYPF